MGAQTIFVKNLSNHAQKFQVHGWNGNKDINVPAHGQVSFSAPDGSSGAIIAVHDGQIGEQAEITKKGFGGNDFIDLSNICGAGGNLVVEQKGDPSTRKGDPLFMQHLDAAWKKAPQATRTKLDKWVFRKDGKVVRMGAPKDNKDLENFVRTFADGKTYIGVGSWNGDPGNMNDNKQSSAAHGSKDIWVTYNDGDARPPKSTSASSSSAPKSTPPTMMMNLMASAPSASAAAADPGPGINLINKRKSTSTFYFYNNHWNGNGTAGANFDHPEHETVLAPGKSKFVSLPSTFKGRVQRGKDLPCTWVEFQLEASNDKIAHGDVSLQQGCDGAATIASSDGTNLVGGFDYDVLVKAPKEACRNKKNGEKALDTTVGNWLGGPNKATIEYLNKTVGQRRVYIVGGTGTPDIRSRNRRFHVTFY